MLLWVFPCHLGGPNLRGHLSSLPPYVELAAGCSPGGGGVLIMNPFSSFPVSVECSMALQDEHPRASQGPGKEGWESAA